MKPVQSHQLSERYTILSDRFRSLWTFYQFLGGVFKHQGRGEIPFSFDFQALYRRMQDLVPLLANELAPETEHELEEIERELARVHATLRKLESEFAPSTLRRFFDHLQRQDEKILFALAKFYLQYETLDADTLDKVDILFTRLAELPSEEGRVAPKSDAELERIFANLAAFPGVPETDPVERSALLVAIREFRSQIEAIPDFDAILSGGIYDRYRRFKHQLGGAYLDPHITIELVKTNITAKNRFQELYQLEEASILEDTNRIFEIERYLEKNPDAADELLRSRIEAFRRFRGRVDSGRQQDNLKREDLAALRRSMQDILDRFEPPVKPSRPTDERPRARVEAARPVAKAAEEAPRSPSRVAPVAEAIPYENPDPEQQRAASTTSLDEILPPDSLLNETLHKMMFALELVIWDHPAEEAVRSAQIANLHLEPWEAEAYRRLSGGTLGEGTIGWQLEHFLLTSAALRIKMEEEDAEIRRLRDVSAGGRLFEILESSAQSLERARETERRFQWFVDDMLYRGDTERLDQLYRSRFRFLKAYATLWLDHQSSGGVTPL